MKRIGRSAAILLLCLALGLSLVPVTARAEDVPGAAASNDAANSVVAEGTCGTNLTWTLDDAGTLTISGTGAMTDWDNPSISNPELTPWYSRISEIKTVVIDSGVTAVGAWAFYSASALTDVMIPDSVTSIGECAFHSCSSLSRLSIPKNLTTWGKGVFQYCSALTSVTIPEGVTEIADQTFYECTALASVVIPSTVTRIGSDAFRECALQSVDLPAGLQTIGDFSFIGCKAITEITIPSNVSSIGSWAFWGCTALKRATILGGDIGYRSFENCSALTSLKLLHTSAPNIAGFAFDGCTGLKTAGPTGSGCDLQFSWTDKIPSRAFWDLPLTSITLPEGITVIEEYAFYGCQISEITIPASVTRIEAVPFCACNSLHKVTLLGDMPTMCTTAGSETFSYITAEIHYPAGNPTYTSGNMLDYGGTLTWIADSSTPVTYQVSYDANGGTGAPASQTKIQGQPITLSSTTPSRADASTGSFTVTFDANGGSVVPASLTAARTTSYTFKNWNTKANGSGTSYSAGASYTTDAAVTLYAQWTEATTTEAVTLPTPTRDGYAFQGWGTSASATDGVTGSFTPTGNVTLYALWIETGGDVHPPIITTQPQTVYTTAGETVKLGFTAATPRGTTLTYQWYRNGEPVLGATSATFLFIADNSMSGDQCYCKVSNSGGSVCTDTVEIWIVTTPKITTQPKAVSVKAGKKVTFKIKAGGEGLQYQWYYQKPKTTKWVKISGATKATYSFTAKKTKNGYKYRCKVTNAAGSATSKAVKLTVK